MTETVLPSTYTGLETANDMPPIVSVIVAAAMSTVATAEPPLVKTRKRPVDPSVGVPEKVIFSGGSGQRFCPFGGGNSDVTPPGRLPCPP